MADLMSFSDVQNIAQKEAQRSEKFILGITKTVPEYIEFPEGTNKFEFVVDVFIVTGVSQQITIGSSGLATMEKVLVASEVSGELLADIHVPVEIRKSTTGQMQIVGRAKVALPALRLDEYTPEQLKIHHIRELDYDEQSEVWRDAFGVEKSIKQYVTTGYETQTSTALANLSQLAYDDSNNFVGLGVNQLQRVIATVTVSVNVFEEATISTAETGSASI